MKVFYGACAAFVVFAMSAANAEMRPVKTGKVKKPETMDQNRTVLDHQLQEHNVVIKIHEKNNSKSDARSFILAKEHVDALETIEHGDLLVLTRGESQLQAIRNKKQIVFQFLPDGREAFVGPDTFQTIIMKARHGEKTKAVHTKKRVPRSEVLRNGGLFLLMGVIMLLAAAFRVRLFGPELPQRKRGKPASTANRLFTAMLGLLVCFWSVFYMLVKIFDIQP